MSNYSLAVDISTSDKPEYIVISEVADVREIYYFSKDLNENTKRLAKELRDRRQKGSTKRHLVLSFLFFKSHGGTAVEYNQCVAVMREETITIWINGTHKLGEVRIHGESIDFLHG